VHNGNVVGKGGIGNEGVCGGRRRGGRKVKVPEAGGWGMAAREKEGTIAVDVKASGGECGGTAVVTDRTFAYPREPLVACCLRLVLASLKKS
jgi:hypothetical protein